ncbi:hypothetical protein [Pedobacter sp.]|uniref:hypothetical protein n=1 Tax=Pedobacter sp. TaxID=1411316 RepID=UPI003BAB611D
MKKNFTNTHLLNFGFGFLFIIYFIIRIVIILCNSSDIGGIEQNVIYSVQTMLNGKSLYSSPTNIPFSITQYTPIYYYICYFTSKIIFLSPDDYTSIYIIGRSWNLIFNLLSAYFIFKIGYSIFGLTKIKSYYLFLLSFILAFPHTFAVRSDSLCDLLAIVSVYFFLLYYTPLNGTKHKLNKNLIVAISLTALSVLSKQSGIQLIIIFIGYSFLIKDWKTFGKLIIYSVIIYGSSIYLFEIIYPSFLQNVVGGIANGIDMTNFYYVLNHVVLKINFWPLLILSIFLIIKLNMWFKGAIKEQILAISTAGFFIFATVTALKMGSAVQYYVLFINFSLLLIFYAIQKGISFKSALMNKVYSISLPIFYFYFLLVICTFIVNDIKVIYKSNFKLNAISQRAATTQVSAFIKKDGNLGGSDYIFTNLTTDSSLPSRQFLNNIFFRNCLVPQMDILEYSTGPSKVLGYENFEEMIRTGKVKYIIESNPKSKFILLKNLENIKKEKFKLVKQFDGYLIYALIPN